MGTNEVTPALLGHVQRARGVVIPAHLAGIDGQKAVGLGQGFAQLVQLATEVGASLTVGRLRPEHPRPRAGAAAGCLGAPPSTPAAPACGPTAPCPAARRRQRSAGCPAARSRCVERHRSQIECHPAHHPQIMRPLGRHTAPGSTTRRSQGVCPVLHIPCNPPRGHGRASYTRLTGVSATRRNRVNPALVTSSRVRASPAWAPSACPPSWALAPGVQTSVDTE
jgi:hypothetical protein